MSRTRKSISFLLPSHWLSYTGGAEYQAKLLIDRLADTTDYELSYLGRRVHSDADTGYRIVNVGNPYWYSKYSKAFDRKRVLRALREITPHLIYQRVAGPYTGIAAEYANEAGCKLVWHIAHDTDLSTDLSGNGIKRRIFSGIDVRAIRRGVERADAIIAQTTSQAELLEERFGKTATAVIPNFHPLVPQVERVGTRGRVIWVANIRRFKGPEVFLRLAEAIGPSAGIEFLMVGREESSGDLGQEIENRGLAGTLKYLGERSQDEVNLLLEQSDMLVNTSVQEGFPNTFIQAWMRGTVVVSLNIDPDGLLTERGLGVRCGSEAALAETVKHLIGAEELRRELSSRARQYVIETHSLKNADKLIEYMRSLL